MPTPPSSGSPHVLVADDQPDVLEALRLLLKGEGYVIDTAESPAARARAVQARTSTPCSRPQLRARHDHRAEGLELVSRAAGARPHAARRRDDRVGQHRERGGGDAARGARLHREAVGQRAAARHAADPGRARPGAARRAGWRPRTALLRATALPELIARVARRCGRSLRADGAGRAVRRERADHRRARHRQGGGGALAPRRLAPARQAVRRGERAAGCPRACSRASCSGT